MCTLVRAIHISALGWKNSQAFRLNIMPVFLCSAMGSCQTALELSHIVVRAQDVLMNKWQILLY